MELMDTIRAFVIENYVKPAKAKGEKTVTICSGDVHKQMDLKNRMPAVCNALRSKKPWNRRYNIQLIREELQKTVIKDSSTNKFTFII